MLRDIIFAAILVGFPLFTVAQEDRDFIPRCGDCWCINDPEGTGAPCPEFSEGFSDDFPDSFHQTYETFNLSSAPIVLQTADGSHDCYPFTDVVGPLDGYPRSNQPQCALPNFSESTVCGFKYAIDPPSNETECCGRQYDLVTYDSLQEAEATGAMLTHSGPCGVCSNAADWAKRIKYAETIEEDLTLCAASYSLSGPNAADRFEKLVSCHKEVSDRVKIGFSDECALLWAHLSATNAALCIEKCAPAIDGGGDFELNGPAPECALSECLECSDSQFQATFDILSGRTVTGSGFTERIARPCDDFASVIHEPCSGLYCTESPTTSGGFAINTYWSLVVGVMTAACIL